MPTFGSLFTGIGGLDLGLERAGWTCAWQVEIDDYCNRVLQRHWPDVPRWRDVRTFPCEQFERVDFICGGDPCQANSKARGSRPAIHESPAIHFLRIVEQLRPRLVLRENPPSRLDAPWPWWRFRSKLESLGYAVLPFRLRACCLGADHQRERVFLLGELPDPMRSRLERPHAEIQQNRDRARRDWRAAAPRVCRGSDGLPFRMERLRGLGNAVVPQVAEYIGRLILEHWMTTSTEDNA